MKQLKVSAIRDGTVIDHLPSEATFKVVDILNLSNTSSVVSVAMNLESKTLHQKGLIKIAGRELNKKEVNKIALVAPNATLNIIKNYKVVSKTKLSIPRQVDGIVKCFNPNCITNHEKVNTRFLVTSTSPLKLKCYYCERFMVQSDIILK
jgi:aspartate carbamoyltransferase regulatory subunit